jgi:hypothetical protein
LSPESDITPNGDAGTGRSGNNPASSVSLYGRKGIMLQWKPQFYAFLTLALLLAAAFLGGMEDFASQFGW